MNIELRNVKYAAFASEETSCFEATVYLDGQKAGTVSNDGHGGCNRYHPWSLEERLNAHAKTLPPQEFDGTTLDMDADLLIGDLLDEWLLSRDLKRALSKRILYTRTDKPGVYQTKPIPADTLPRLLTTLATEGDATREKWHVAQVLNAMPFADALAIYRKEAA